MILPSRLLPLPMIYQQPTNIQYIPPAKNQPLNQPILNYTTHSPPYPEYYENVNISTQITTNTTIADVSLYYRINTGNWQNQTMTNNTLNFYWAILSRRPWGHHVEYYINASDIQGRFTIDDNHSQYYHYTVRDSVPPAIDIISPQPSQVFHGQVWIEMDFEDPGSDIDFNERYLNNQLMGSGTSDDLNLLVSIPNGVYTLVVYVYDYAGNRAEAEVTFSVQANPSIPIIVLEVATISIIIGTCLIIITYSCRRENANRIRVSSI